VTLLTEEMCAAAAHAEQIKRRMRVHYASASKPYRGHKVPFDRQKAISDEFWGEYDDVNQRLCPWDPVYTGTRGGVTLATTTDLATLSVGSSGQLRILESFLAGESAASAVERLAVQRSTGGATPTNQTPEKASTRSPAAVATFATNWTTQPTLSGNPLLYHDCNTFGGTDRWVPSPGEEIYLVNSEILSWRSASGTSVVSSHHVWEEM